MHYWGRAVGQQMVGEGKETGNKNETINLRCSLLETGHKFCFYSEQFQFFADFSSPSPALCPYYRWQGAHRMVGTNDIYGRAVVLD